MPVKLLVVVGGSVPAFIVVWVWMHALLAGPMAVPADAISAQVLRVIDGDTISLWVEDEVVDVDLWGVDAPETGVPDQPVDCYGREATAFLSDLLPVGSDVMIAGDAGQTGADGSVLLRNVWSEDGELVQERLLAGGYASLSAASNAQYDDLFHQAEDTARSTGVGLWARPDCWPADVLEPVHA